jgi:hypothetical protein
MLNKTNDIPFRDILWCLHTADGSLGQYSSQHLHVTRKFSIITTVVRLVVAEMATVTQTQKEKDAERTVQLALLDLGYGLLSNS